MTLVWLEDLRLNAELSGPIGAPPLVLIHGTFVETVSTFGKLWTMHPQRVRELFLAKAIEEVGLVLVGVAGPQQPSLAVRPDVPARIVAGRDLFGPHPHGVVQK